MRRVIPALVLVCAALAPATSFAQSRPPASNQQPARRPPPKKPPVGVRLYGFYEFDALAAADTFNAVTGSSTTNGFGGGFEVTNVASKLFIRGTVAHAGKDGERVFVNNGEIFKLGIPLTVAMTPIEFGGGWRSVVDRRGRWAIYAGAGVVFLNYSETTPSGTADDNTSKTFTGYSLFGGFDRTFHKNLVAGAEVQYRGVPNAIGTAGTSAAFGETDLGGFAIRALFGVKW
jgi:opacity protein-like surface antigen